MHNQDTEPGEELGSLIAYDAQISRSNYQLESTHPQPPKAKSINNFEAATDTATQKVRLRPLAITPDLRRQVEEK